MIKVRCMYTCMKVPKDKHKVTTIILKIFSSKRGCKKMVDQCYQFFEDPEFRIQLNVHTNGKTC